MLTQESPMSMSKVGCCVTTLIFGGDGTPYISPCAECVTFPLPRIKFKFSSGVKWGWKAYTTPVRAFAASISVLLTDLASCLF